MTYNILVADDSPEIAKMCRFLFIGTYGTTVNVTTVGNGSSALEEIATREKGGDRIALLLTDVDMGAGPDGFKVVKTVKAEYGYIKCAVMTGMDRPNFDYTGEARRLDVTLIQKPFTPTTLLAALKEYLPKVQAT